MSSLICSLVPCSVTVSFLHRRCPVMPSVDVARVVQPPRDNIPEGGVRGILACLGGGSPWGRAVALHRVPPGGLPMET